ncbi:MAG: membrane dipeptidase [Granulosicoccus sp.]|jgi:membrane dipeptidase
MSTDSLSTLYKNSLVWDAHAGIFPAVDADLSHVTDWVEAGVDFVSINIGFDVLDWTETVAVLSAYRCKLREMSEHVCLIDNLDDVKHAKQTGKLAVSFDIEGLKALNNDVGMVSVYYDLGVRQMLFAYNLNNAGSSGCHDVDHGLTDFGKSVVKEMNRIGMTIDLSHVGYLSSMDIIELSEKPVVFTHSNPRNLWDHERNIKDEQIKACAEKGGVIGVNGMGIFLGDNDVSAETFANHVCYIADLTAPEYVCFGLDWKPRMKSATDLGAILSSRPDYWPAGQQYDTPELKIFSPNQLIDALVILQARGWSDAQLQGFLGENFMRVVEKTWH